jgi:hypothetical protein
MRGIAAGLAFAAGVVGCAQNRPETEVGLLRITTSPHEEMEPQWAPDGRRLSYGSGREGDQNVVVYDFSTQTETQLTQGLGFVHATTWSRGRGDPARGTARGR